MNLNREHLFPPTTSYVHAYVLDTNTTSPTTDAWRNGWFFEKWWDEIVFMRRSRKEVQFYSFALILAFGGDWLPIEMLNSQNCIALCNFGKWVQRESKFKCYKNTKPWMARGHWMGKVAVRENKCPEQCKHLVALREREKGNRLNASIVSERDLQLVN